MGLFSRIRENISKGIKAVKRTVENLISDDSQEIDSQLASQLAQIDTSSGDYEVKDYIEKDPLQSLKDASQPLIDMANSRLVSLREENLTSPAMAKFIEEHGDNESFNTANLLSKEDIYAELTRANVFMNDETSTLEGARKWQTQLKIESFNIGNIMSSEEIRSLSLTDNITSEYASVAYSIFRDIESLEAYKTALYDSDKIFNYIYNEVVEQGITWGENGHYGEPSDESKEFIDLIRGRAMSILDASVGNAYHDFKRSFDEEAAKAETLYRKAKKEGDYFGSRDYF